MKNENSKLVTIIDNITVWIWRTDFSRTSLIKSIEWSKLLLSITISNYHFTLSTWFLLVFQLTPYFYHLTWLLNSWWWIHRTLNFLFFPSIIKSLNVVMVLFVISMDMKKLVILLFIIISSASLLLLWNSIVMHWQLSSKVFILQSKIHWKFEFLVVDH